MLPETTHLCILTYIVKQVSIGIRLASLLISIRQLLFFQVLQKGRGTMIVARRPQGEAKASSYLPCEFCKGFFQKQQLYLHVKSCMFRTEEVTERNFVRNARCLLSPFMPRVHEDVAYLNSVIQKMRETKKHPGLQQICFEDELIREFGCWLSGKLGSKNEQRRKDEDNVRTKMRALARLLMKLNEGKTFRENLSFYISPRQFKVVVQAVKELYKEANSPQLGLTLGHYIKQVSLLKGSVALQLEDRKMKNEANDFMELYRALWISNVASVADRSKRLNALNRRCNLPCTEDLVRLKEDLEKKISDLIKNTDPTYAEYVSMTQVLIARIVLFNKRRISEVDELTVSDFNSRLSGQELDANTEIINSLGIAEQSLLRR